MSQSRRMSAVEAATNIAVGYVLAILTQYAVFPLFGLVPRFHEHLLIGATFVGVSLCRSYVLRRAFNGLER